MRILILTVILSIPANAQMQSAADWSPNPLTVPRGLHFDLLNHPAADPASKSEFERLRGEWIYTDEDRRFVQISIEVYARQQDWANLALAESLLEDHTHPTNVAALITALTEIEGRNAILEAKLQSRLKDHLFYSEPRRLAVEHANGDDPRRAVLAKVANLPTTPAPAVGLRLAVTNEHKAIIDNLSDPNEAVVRKALLKAKTEQLDIRLELRKLITENDHTEGLRIEAYDQFPTDTKLPLAQKLLTDPTTPSKLLAVAAGTIATSGKLLDLIALKDEMTKGKTEFRRLTMARALSTSKDGGELLLAAAKNNEALLTLLKDETVTANLKTAKVRDAESRVQALLK